jgi:predicted ATP-grasp superfamily ATP-dependent carboligase
MSAMAEARSHGAPAPASTPLRPTGAVVLGSDYRALGVVRSLGRRGVPVHLIVDVDDRLAARSRYVQSRSNWPRSDDERLEHLDSIVRRAADPLALFPSADETAAFVSRNHETLSRRYALTTPPWDVFRWAYDKRLTHELGERAGVKCPRTLYPRDRADLEQAELEFPVVIKPRTKPRFNRLVAAKAWRVDDRDELMRRYDEAASLADPTTLMVQEVIPGGDGANLAYAALTESGQVLHHIVARRTRQYPPDFGRASTFVESIDDPGIGEPSRRVLEACGFTGLIEVEFKVDERSGQPVLLDMNPRVWGWHTLGRRAGVDFPWLQWLRLRGEQTPYTQPVAGVRWLRISTDLPTAVKEIIKGRQPFWPYVSSLLLPHERAIFARDDPMPGLLEMPLMARILVRRLAAGDGV